MADVIAWIMANYQTVVAAAVALISGIVAVALIFPGDEPERTLGKVLDVLKKLSKK